MGNKMRGRSTIIGCLFWLCGSDNCSVFAGASTQIAFNLFS